MYHDKTIAKDSVVACGKKKKKEKNDNKIDRNKFTEFWAVCEYL